MRKSLIRGVSGVGALLGTALLLSAQTQGSVARPGMVNYAEGQVTLDGQTIGAKQIGHAEVAPGHVLQTQDGKAEMLLTPGVFLRLSDHSAVRMISPSITDTRVELVRGEAMVEAAQVEKENRLDVVDAGAQTLIQKHGVYEFKADHPMVAVFDGKAEVQVDDHSVEVGKHRELALDQGQTKLKPEKFDVDQAKATDPLYNWSKLRSEYISEANASTAQTIVLGNPGWWAGTGWYWNPYFDTWAFMPGTGYLYSPFGFGFYSPAYWSYAVPVYRGFYGRYGRGYYGRGYRAPVVTARPGVTGRSFNSGLVGGFTGGRVGGFSGGRVGGFSGGHFGGAHVGGRR